MHNAEREREREREREKERDIPYKLFLFVFMKFNDYLCTNLKMRPLPLPNTRSHMVFIPSSGDCQK